MEESSTATTAIASDHDGTSTDVAKHFPQANSPNSSWGDMWLRMTGSRWFRCTFDGITWYHIHRDIADNLSDLMECNYDGLVTKGEEADIVNRYTEGVHYFTSLQSLQEYAHKYLGWGGNGATDTEVEESDNDDMYKKIQPLLPAAKLVLFAAVYLRVVYPTSDITLTSLRKYYGEEGISGRVVNLISILEKSGLYVRNGMEDTNMDTEYTTEVQLRDMEAVIGKNFYKEGQYKKILDRINSTVAAAPSDSTNDKNQNNTQPLLQQENSANGMNSRKQPTDKNEPIKNKKKDNKESLQQAAGAATLNKNGATDERLVRMTTPSTVSSPSTAAPRISLSPETAKKPPKAKRSTRSTNKLNDSSNQVDESSLSTIYKKLGWQWDGGVCQDYSFFPPSLLKKYKLGEIKRIGTPGIHYADGYQQLGEMLMKYGCHHAPQSLDVNPTELDEKVSLKDIINELFGEEKVGGKSAKAKAATRGECMSIHVISSKLSYDCSCVCVHSQLFRTRTCHG